MKKLLALLLTLVFVLSLVACGSSDTGSDLSSELDSSQATSDDNSSKITSSQATSSQAKPTTPTKLNPKTDFKYGTYVAKFYSNDKKTYTECTLIFNKEYESLQYECATYYTREECERLYGGVFGFDADNLTEDFPVITLNGVKYYTFYPAYTILPETFEITDTVIKISPDNEKWGTLSLNANGTLVVDKTDDEPRYGKVGTVYTFVEE